IVSSGPRCGTTLLHEIMKSCFEFDSYSNRECSICVSNYKMGGGQFILSKYPFEVDISIPIIKCFRSIYLICLIRDPRDMVVSFHGGNYDKYWCSLDYWNLFCNYYDKIKDSK